MPKQTPELVISKTHWQVCAEELFLADFEDPKKFYKQYDEPVAVYSELAKRALDSSDENHARLAYKLMFDAYAADQTNNNHDELDKLIEIEKSKGQ